MSKDVIIIGGGIAGLTAASELHDCRVTLLEAKPRLGGRIHTIRLRGGLVELGAEFVHGKSEVLMEAIRAAHLPMAEVVDDNQLFEYGRLEPVEVWDTFDELTSHIDTRTRDRSFLDFLGEQSMDETTRRMMLAFATGFNAAHADRLSAHSLRRAEYASEQIGGDMQTRIEAGYSTLVDFEAARAKHAGATILTNTCVKTIRWRADRVEVEAEHDCRLRTYKANAAIVTLPLGVLKARDVQFVPAIPDKEEAIDGMEFGNVVKITLLFKRRWWPDGDFGFVHSLEDSIPTWWSDSRSPVIVGWAGGEKADALVNATREELEKIGVNILSRVFSKPDESIRRDLNSSHMHNWAKDPYVRGAYSYIPVDGLFLPKQLGAPVENTLFFAGEATAQDAQMGTVFAAMESGRRAARELTAVFQSQSLHA